MPLWVMKVMLPPTVCVVHVLEILVQPVGHVAAFVQAL